jgi:uncharacterized protein
MKQVALITGASSGIGKELAYIHAKNGCDLVLVARRKKELKELKKKLEFEFHVTAVVIAKDLSFPSAAREIYSETQSMGITVEYLINNAGFGGFGYFHERSMDNFMNMIHVNIISLMLLTRLYLPGMIVRGSGRILNVSSTASFVPGPLQAVYFASKAFVTSFSQAIAEEVKDKGVTVTALCPGMVDTEFVELSGMGESNIMKHQKPASPEKTARIGYHDMMKGKLLSFDNRMLKFSINWLIHLFPRKTILKILRKTMDKKTTFTS